MYYKKLHEGGITFIRDLLDENQKLLPQLFAEKSILKFLFQSNGEKQSSKRRKTLHVRRAWYQEHVKCL